jgi:5-hydroxyisourate hydrolase-like protein (transthyretin family)
MNIVKKTTVYIIILLVFGANILYAATGNTETSQRQGNPMQMLDNFANKVNKDDRIQDTALNDTSNIQGQYASEFKIANTLDSIRIQIAPYIQRTMYIGLSLAVLGIIYN